MLDRKLNALSTMRRPEKRPSPSLIIVKILRNFVDKCLADTGVAVSNFWSVRLPLLHLTALASVLRPGAIVSVSFRAGANIAFGNSECFKKRFSPMFPVIFISPMFPATVRAFILAIEYVFGGFGGHIGKLVNIFWMM